VVAYEKVEHDISLGRIAGPFRFRPISKFEKFPHGISTLKDLWLESNNTLVKSTFA
jgi:predicted Mrr-cat superfamily restriction endonuclease